MGLMNAFDSQTEDSSPAIGRNLRSRPLARKKLSEMVEEELEQMIRRREFGEGEQLPSERELMAFFNVGRPSVREALAALKRKGLVQINNGERARVSRPSADTIIGELSGMAKDFLSHPGGIAHFEQLRLFFESSLVRYAAEHATDEQIDLLAKALEINSQSLDNNAAFIRSDVDFHRVLAEIPGNPIFMAIHVALLDWLIAARQRLPIRHCTNITTLVINSILRSLMRSAVMILTKPIVRCNRISTASLLPGTLSVRPPTKRNNATLVKQIAL